MHNVNTSNKKKYSYSNSAPLIPSLTGSKVRYSFVHFTLCFHHYNFFL